MRGARQLAIVAIVAAAVLVAVPATAATTKSFSGKLEVNDAPVTFDVKKRNGRYRRIPLMNFGDGTTGVPMECEGNPTEQALSYGEVSVARDGTIFETDGFATIKAEFSNSLERLRGTLKVNGEGQGTFCTTHGPLDFKASLIH